MCGFLGFVGDTTPEDIQDNFLYAFDSINHRGPDSSKIHSSENLLLGFKRLAIIDLDIRSNQPFSDGTNFLLFNGEIYNYQVLKDELIKDYGCHFNTSGDTEVLFNGLICKGEDFLEEIDGMFALCFINKDKEIILARDKYGQKPLFFNIDHNLNLTFGSELASIIKFLGKNSFEINDYAFLNYFQYGASIAPQTFYKGLMQVVPGETIKIDRRKENIIKNNRDDSSQKNTSKITIKKALTKRLKACYVSDTPIALLSSGGVDSSAILKTAKFIPNSVSAIAVHLNTQKDQQGLSIAKKMETLDLPLTIINSEVTTTKSNKDLIDILLDRFGEPYADTSYFYSEELYSMIPDKYKVVIGGDGADEVFKGYKPSSFFYVASLISKIIPLKIRKFLIFNSKNMGKLGLYSRILLGCKSSMEKLLMGFESIRLNSLSILVDDKIKKEYVDILTGKEITKFYYDYLDIRLKNVFMRKSDHASMKYSKELRSPYLQNNTDEFKKMDNFFSNFIPKLKLKIYLLDYLNPLGIFRKKVGFDITSKKIDENRRTNILDWCNNNKKILDNFFEFSEFINLVKEITKANHLMRIEVFLRWLKTNHEKK